MEDGFGEETVIQSVEGILTRIVPSPRGILFGEIEERMHNVRVITNKLSVEVGESKERMDVFYLGWGRPISDSIKFSGVHFDVSMGQYHPKVVNV